MPDCDICVNTFTTLIQCTKCTYKICKTCTSKYLCESINEPKCMNCKHSFTREFLIEQLGTSWYNGKYKNTRKEVLLESEKALFPSTVEFADNFKNIHKFENMVKKLQEELSEKSKEFSIYQKSMMQKIHSVENQIIQLKHGGQVDTDGQTSQPEKTKCEIYTKCPKKECVGMLNDKHRCITCNIKVCKKCSEIMSEQHVCDENTIATIQLLKKDTKNCPGCGIPIHRLQGCYQMWCTNCHCTFHYRTLEILNETIHNPHYVEWLRHNTTIKQQDGDCQALGFGSFDKFRKKHDVLYKSCQNIFSHLTHIGYTDLEHARRRLQSFTNNDERRLRRTQYMLGIIDEKKYKMLLFKSYKQTQRWSDVIDLINMFINALRNILSNVLVTEDFEILKQEISTICSYVKTQHVRINKIYGNFSQFKINNGINTVGVITFRSY